MKTSTIIILGSVAAVGIGVAVFLGTREAKARETAKKAFKVNADCSVIEVVDEAAFQDAAQAAAIAAYEGMDEQADAMFDRVVGVLLKNFPQCPARLDGLTVVKIPNQMPVPISVVRALITGKTVGQLKDDVASGKFSLEGSAGDDVPQQPFRDRLMVSLFGGLQ